MIHPKGTADLLLAPVAVEIDRNLQRFRTHTPEEIENELQLELDQPLIENTREERARRILRVAMRDVQMHGWEGHVNYDASAIHLDGGSVSLDIALSPTVRQYIERGLTAA